MRVRKLKRQEIRAVMPMRHNGLPGVLAVGVTAVIIAAMMILAATPGLAEIVEGWGNAELVETNDGSASSPQVAMDGDGNAIAVWGQSNDIWSNRYVVGVGWGDAELVETGDGYASPPQVAMNGGGNAVAVWQQSDGGREHIWSNRYIAEVGWGDAQLIETDDRGAYNPQVAMDEDGNAIAVWFQSDGTELSIWSNRYAVGVGWGDAQVIEASDGFAWNHQVSMDGSGNAIAIWEQFNIQTFEFSIWSNRYVAGIGWGDAESVEPYTGEAYSPQVAMDVNGNAIAVWRQFDGTQWDIWSNRYAVGVGWCNAAIIETDDRGAYNPQVAMDGDGSAIAVWFQGNLGQYSIWSNRYVVGAGWGDAQPIETEDGDAHSSQVAMDVNGNAVAVWRQFDGIRYSIWSNWYVAGVGWGDAQLIETDDGETYYPQVAMGGGGNAVAVWQQFDGAQDSIWSNRFTSLANHFQYRHCTGDSDVDATTL